MSSTLAEQSSAEQANSQQQNEQQLENKPNGVQLFCAELGACVNDEALSNINAVQQQLYVNIFFTILHM